MGFRPALGNSDFRNLRRSDRDYIDKSALITDVIDDPGAILPFPRPRRFGKILNLSMLRYFFEHSEEDREDLFADLQVWRSDRARAQFQRKPPTKRVFLCGLRFAILR